MCRITHQGLRCSFVFFGYIKVNFNSGILGHPWSNILTPHSQRHHIAHTWEKSRQFFLGMERLYLSICDVVQLSVCLSVAGPHAGKMQNWFSTWLSPTVNTLFFPYSCIWCTINDCPSKFKPFRPSWQDSQQRHPPSHDCSQNFRAGPSQVSVMFSSGINKENGDMLLESSSHHVTI